MNTKHTHELIELEFDYDSEGDNNRGWQVAKITAFVKGEEAGYLKLAYIPKQRFVEYYPSIFNWMDQIKGNCIMPRPKVDGDDYTAFRAAAKRHYNDFTVPELQKFLNTTSYLLNRRDVTGDLSGLTYDELIAHAKGLESVAEHRYGKEFKKFKTYYVDKPIDDFIRVEREYQRQGIAEYLYKVGVQWLDSQGLPFYLSTCRQTGSASDLLAQKFRDNKNIRKMSNRRERFIVDSIRL